MRTDVIIFCVAGFAFTAFLVWVGPYWIARGIGREEHRRADQRMRRQIRAYRQLLRTQTREGKTQYERASRMP